MRILACAALVALLALQLALPQGSSLPTPTAGLAARRLQLARPPFTPQSPAILRAPLFAPDRLPGQARMAAPADAAGSDTMLGYSALGVAMGHGAAAGVVSAPGGKVTTLKIGDAVEGWRLVGLDRTRLSFARNGVRRDLVVGAPAETTAPPTPAAAQ